MDNNQAEHTLGIKCPHCGMFVPLSINELLIANEFRCPSCGLELKQSSEQDKKSANDSTFTKIASQPAQQFRTDHLSQDSKSSDQ